MIRKRRNLDEEKKKNLIKEQQVLDSFDNLKIEKEGNRNGAWERFSQSLAHTDQKPKTISRTLFYYSVAASVIVIISLSVFYFSYYSKTTFHAAYGQISEFYLPDSSIVILNADSKVTFNKNGWDKKRNVSLEGEAFFDVRKGNDFYIETDEATVKVLGTTFNVYSRDGFFSVKCKTGKILVESKLFESADTLISSEAIDITVGKSNSRKKYNLGNKDASAWINGEFYYNDIPLGEVIKEIERQFNVKVYTSDIIKERHYSGYFRNDDLVGALDYICTPMNLKYKISKGNTIRIY